MVKAGSACPDANRRPAAPANTKNNNKFSRRSPPGLHTINWRKRGPLDFRQTRDAMLFARARECEHLPLP
eukprot:1889496-Alexandrium_andersonii.AAC.1